MKKCYLLFILLFALGVSVDVAHANEPDRFGVHVASCHEEQDARNAWTKLRARYERLLARSGCVLEKQQLAASRPSFYRVIIGPFASRAEAAWIQERLKADGEFAKITAFPQPMTPPSTAQESAKAPTSGEYTSYTPPQAPQKTGGIPLSHELETIQIGDAPPIRQRVYADVDNKRAADTISINLDEDLDLAHNFYVGLNNQNNLGVYGSFEAKKPIMGTKLRSTLKYDVQPAPRFSHAEVANVIPLTDTVETEVGVRTGLTEQPDEEAFTAVRKDLGHGVNLKQSLSYSTNGEAKSYSGFEINF